MSRLFLFFLPCFILYYTSPENAFGRNTRHLYKKKRAYSKKRYHYIHLDTANKSIPELLRTFFDYYLPQGSFNGAVLVAQQNDILFERYSGWADREKQIPIDANTSFHVASVSKTFTAAAVLKLAQENKLDLKDPVVKYLPDFLYTDITVEDLLCHRSGLKTYDKFMRRYFKGGKDSFLSNEQVLHIINAHPKQKIAKAGQKFYYSNSNYALLALIIEAVSGTPYKNFMEDSIFRPLHLTHTRIFDIDSTTEEYTPSYDINFHRERYNFLDGVLGDKGVYTSVSDLLKWDSILQTHTFLSQKFLNKAFSSHSHKHNKKGYGLGWRLDSVEKFDKKLVYHFGWWHGNRAVFIRDITKGATVIVLSNKFNRNIYRAKELVTRYDLF